MRTLELRTSGAEATVLVGDASEFANDDPDYRAANTIAKRFKGKVAYLEWLKAKVPGSGAGSALLERLLSDWSPKVKLFVLQAIPMGGRNESVDANIQDLVRYYERFGFVRTALADRWSSYPIMIRKSPRSRRH